VTKVWGTKAEAEAASMRKRAGVTRIVNRNVLVCLEKKRSKSNDRRNMRMNKMERACCLLSTLDFSEAVAKKGKRQLEDNVNDTHCDIE
jgi:urease accessory protein UreH